VWLSNAPGPPNGMNGTCGASLVQLSITVRVRVGVRFRRVGQALSNFLRNPTRIAARNTHAVLTHDRHNTSLK